MKIKHFAGYGSVNAQKLSKTTENGVTTMVIKVWGSHEWGLGQDRTWDKSGMARWLLTNHFDKAVTFQTPILSMEVKDMNGNILDGETCTFVFKYEL